MDRSGGGYQASQSGSDTAATVRAGADTASRRQVILRKESLNHRNMAKLTVSNTECTV